MRRLLIGLLALLPLLANAGEIYKWTDANGQVHFGDKTQAPKASQEVPLETRPLTTYAPPKITPPTVPPRKASLADGLPATGTVARTFNRWKSDGRQSNLPRIEQNPAGLNPRCIELAQKIRDLPQATPYQSEVDEISRLCPNVGYDCRYYRTLPSHNRCYPVKLTDGDPALVKTLETD